MNWPPPFRRILKDYRDVSATMEVGEARVMYHELTWWGFVEGVWTAHVFEDSDGELGALLVWERRLRNPFKPLTETHPATKPR